MTSAVIWKSCSNSYTTLVITQITLSSAQLGMTGSDHVSGAHWSHWSPGHCPHLSLLCQDIAGVKIFIGHVLMHWWGLLLAILEVSGQQWRLEPLDTVCCASLLHSYDHIGVSTTYLDTQLTVCQPKPTNASQLTGATLHCDTAAAQPCPVWAGTGYSDPVRPMTCPVHCHTVLCWGQVLLPTAAQVTTVSCRITQFAEPQEII